MAVFNAPIKEAAADIHEYTESVSDYCEGLCIPTKTIKIYHNNKPWFKTDIKHKLQAKQEAYKDKYKQTRYAAEKAIKTAKANYRDNLEENLTTNIWQGLKAITNYKPSSKSADITDTTLPDHLNDFTVALINRTSSLLPL